MADGEGTAGTVIKDVAPLANAIPVAGPIVSGLLSVGGGLLEQDAAKKQAEQAQNERRQANALKPRLLDENYWKAYHAAKMASLSNMPGYEDYINNLAKNSANQMRAIQESSPNGAATLAAISALHEKQNEGLNKLGVQNATYKAGLEGEVRQDLWNLGGEKDKQQAITDANKRLMYQQANALETAATANKQTGWNQILGGLSSGVTQLTKNAGDTQNNSAFNQWYNNYIGNQPIQNVPQAQQTSLTSLTPTNLQFSTTPY